MVEESFEELFAPLLRLTALHCVALRERVSERVSESLSRESRPTPSKGTHGAHFFTAFVRIFVCFGFPLSSTRVLHSVPYNVHTYIHTSYISAQPIPGQQPTNHSSSSSSSSTSLLLLLPPPLLCPAARLTGGVRAGRHRHRQAERQTGTWGTAAPLHLCDLRSLRRRSQPAGLAVTPSRSHAVTRLASY